MSWKHIVAIAVAVAVGGAFLTGYVPERRRRTAAQQEAVTLRDRLDAAEVRVRMGQLLGQALAVRDVVARQNYGQAQELASVFFDGVRREVADTSNEEFRSVLNESLSRRDAVTAALAKADPEVAAVLRTIEGQIRRALGYPVPAEAAPQ